MKEAEEKAQRAMIDAARLTDELEHEQEVCKYEESKKAQGAVGGATEGDAGSCVDEAQGNALEGRHSCFSLYFIMIVKTS